MEALRKPAGRHFEGWPETNPGSSQESCWKHFEPGGILLEAVFSLKQVLESLRRFAGSCFESDDAECVLEALVCDLSRGLLELFFSQVA